MPSFLANVHASLYRDGAPQELTPEQEAYLNSWTMGTV